MAVFGVLNRSHSVVSIVGLVANISMAFMNNFGIGIAWLDACQLFQLLTSGSFLKCCQRALYLSFTACLPDSLSRAL